MSYTYEALSPGGHQEMLKEVFSKVREQVGSYKTASGSLVSFSDSADLPMPSFVCNISANQDLHGYDAPWVGGAGKNKLPMTVDGIKTANGGANTWNGNSKVINDITFTILTDNEGEIIGVNVNGTATADAVVTILVDTSKVYGDLYFVGCNGGSNNTYNALMWDATTNARAKKWDGTTASANSIDGTFQQVKIAQGNNVKFQLRVMNGQTVNNVIFQPMICLSTETDPTFAPYSNICPISGHTGVDAWVRGKNLANPATVTTLYPTGDSGTYPNQIRSSSNARSVIAEVTPDTTYTISKKAGQRFRLAFTEEEPANGVADMGYEWNDTGTTITVTSPSNAKYMVVLFWSANVDTDTEEDMLATVQIEIGETATTYELYNPNSQTIQVSWQTEAGEVYGGYIDLVSGELTVDRVGVTYSDADRKRDDGSFRLYPAPSNALVTNTDNEQPSPLFICDKYKFMSVYEVITTKAVNVGIGISKTSTSFYIKDTTMLQMTLEEAQTYLSSHPIDVVYPLETPIIYQLTPTQIKSLRGNNNAWCSTGSIKSLQYQPNNIIAELRSEILALQARVEELEEEIPQQTE